jgi:hypothetical protein
MHWNFVIAAFYNVQRADYGRAPRGNRNLQGSDPSAILVSRSTAN